MLKSLRHDSGNAAEVAGAEGALERLRQLFDLDPGLEARRVHLFRRGDEEVVDALALGERCIASSSRGYRDRSSPRRTAQD